MASTRNQITLILLWCVLLFVARVQSDYTCFCNYNIETAVYPTPDIKVAAVGYLYEFDCKPIATPSTQGSFYVVQFEQQVTIYCNIQLWYHIYH